MTLRRARPALGTLVDIAVECTSMLAGRRAVAGAVDEIAAVEAVFSAHRASSEAVRLSLQAHRAPMRVSAPMQRVLTTALDLYRASGGIFDVAVGGTLAARQLLPPLLCDIVGHGVAGNSRHIYLGPDGRVSFR
ncbi:MAG TPA: FAD:protein FMN transferase, partial [Steroidobacteraceae bacterium]